jgi:NAD(P)-dependent dehydrogenase (short-subunit alcohol dehydrogenase family)
MRRVIITGANRGLGLEFTRQSLARGDRVIAGYRDPQHADALNALATAHPDRLHVRALDVADARSITAFAQEASHLFDGLDLLINNAGKNVPGERFGEVAVDALDACFQTNAVAPFLLAQTLAPLLRKGNAPVVANLSSRLGSIALTNGFYTPSYAISKAALNMATVLLAQALKGDGVRVIALTPGWVKTDMGGDGAQLLPAASVSGMLGVIDATTMEGSGTFADYLGEPVPW